MKTEAYLSNTDPEMSADPVSKTLEHGDVPSGSSPKRNTNLHPPIILMMEELVIPPYIKQDLPSGHSYESSSKDCPGLSSALIIV